MLRPIIVPREIDVSHRSPERGSIQAVGAASSPFISDVSTSYYSSNSDSEGRPDSWLGCCYYLTEGSVLAYIQ